VVVPFDGEPVFARFASWSPECPTDSVGDWLGVGEESWVSSADRLNYMNQVEFAREAISRGEVYQVNVCRVLSAALPEAADIAALHVLLNEHNPAPYSAMVRLPAQGVHIASASPELYLKREGNKISSGPIKGTGAVAADLVEKDRAENVMIVDLVRNDLSQIAEVGSVQVTGLLETEFHPGLVHLVSHVSARVSASTHWKDIAAATFPPGSISGAPKSTALALIAELESASREFYCGAVGWVDADEGTACLSVAIRTFWRSGDQLRFGTGAGITWGSDPESEWRETELKAAHLCSVAAKSWQADPS
jgi:para-aminobenzoate synthetase component 1